MKTLADIRKEYPQYADMSDEDLGRALHSKFYADMPYDQFAQRAGIAAPTPPQEPSFIDSAKQFAGEQARGFGRSAGVLARDVIEGGLGTVGILTDPAVLSVGAAIDRPFATAQQTGAQFADFLGLPKPEGGVEQGISQVQQAVTGGGGLAALSRQAAKRIPGLAGQVFERMAANPGTQIASAAGAATGSEVAGQTAEGIGFSPEIQTGARIVGGLVGGVAPLGAGYITSPIQASAARTIRQDVPNIDDLLSRPAPSRTPRVVRTLAEETLDPDVVNLERRITATGANAVPNRQIANEAAQVQELQRIAGSESDLVSAIASRDRVTTPLRAQALRQENVDITTALSRLSGAERALKGRDEVQSVISGVRRALASAQKPTRTGPLLTPEGGGASMQELYNIRKRIGDILGGLTETPRAAATSRELMLARDAIDGAISRRVPEFKQYLDAYKSMSGDVNRLQFGQELLRRSVRSDGDVNRLMPGAFVSNTEGLGTTARRAGANVLARDATLFSKATAAGILPPEDIAALSSIRSDLLRRQRVADIRGVTAGGGSQTAIAQNLTDEARGALSEILDKIPLVSSLQSSARARLDGAIAEALANPERARAILMRFPSSEQSAARNAMLAVGVTLEPTPQE